MKRGVKIVNNYWSKDMMSDVKGYYLALKNSTYFFFIKDSISQINKLNSHKINSIH